jgi:hypothetical protein
LLLSKINKQNTKKTSISNAKYIIVAFVNNKHTVTPPKLALANPVESLAIHPVEPTSGQTGNRP